MDNTHPTEKSAEELIQEFTERIHHMTVEELKELMIFFDSQSDPS